MTEREGNGGVVCKWCEAPIWPASATAFGVDGEGVVRAEVAGDWVTKFGLEPFGHKHEPGEEIVSRFRETGMK